MEKKAKAEAKRQRRNERKTAPEETPAESLDDASVTDEADAVDELANDEAS